MAYPGNNNNFKFIVSVNVVDTGDLIVEFSDGSTLNAGYVVGPEGPRGDAALPGAVETVLVSEDYESTIDNCYIGVNSNRPVTISLPVDISDGHQIAIKAEMAGSLSHRRITVDTLDGSLIDGELTYVISVPYESIHLIYRGNEWHII
jgi:hypothetical protein